MLCVYGFVCHSLDRVHMVRFVDRGNFDFVILGYHIVLELPAGASGKFGDDSITISEEVNVEVDMIDRLSLCQ
jgi:hypothetical protein